MDVHTNAHMHAHTRTVYLGMGLSCLLFWEDLETVFPPHALYLLQATGFFYVTGVIFYGTYTPLQLKSLDFRVL